jgi:hypothetical protein
LPATRCEGPGSDPCTSPQDGRLAPVLGAFKRVPPHLNASIALSATTLSHTVSGIHSLGFLRTLEMSRAPPPLRNTSRSLGLTCAAGAGVQTGVQHSRLPLLRLASTSICFRGSTSNCRRCSEAAATSATADAADWAARRSGRSIGTAIVSMQSSGSSGEPCRR